MKNHAWRPFAVAIAAIALLLLARAQIVPADFGINGKSFTYNFYRKSDIKDWKAITVKYKGREYCNECHEEKLRKSWPLLIKLSNARIATDRPWVILTIRRLCP